MTCVVEFVMWHSLGCVIPVLRLCCHKSIFPSKVTVGLEVYGDRKLSRISQSGLLSLSLYIPSHRIQNTPNIEAGVNIR